jgi:hypothetical protein
MERTKRPTAVMTRKVTPKSQIRKGADTCEDCRQNKAQFQTLPGKDNQHDVRHVCQWCAMKYSQQGYRSWHLPEKGEK